MGKCGLGAPGKPQILHGIHENPRKEVPGPRYPKLCPPISKGHCTLAREAQIHCPDQWAPRSRVRHGIGSDGRGFLG